MTPRSRFETLDPQKRESILSAASHEFADRGYEAASLNRIIEIAGISKGTLYYYFEDKEDLFATALEDASRRLMIEAGFADLSDLGHDSFWDSFRSAAHRSMELVHRDDAFLRLARSFRRFRADHASSAATARIMDHARRVTEDFIAKGRELGTVRMDLPADLLVEMTRAVDEAGDRWMLEHWGSLDEAERLRLTDARLDALRDMLDADHEGWGR